MRNGRHEEQHELDEDYYDLPDQTNNSSRGGGAGDTKNDDQEDLGEEVDRREVLVRATYDTRRQKFDEKNRCDMVEGVGQKEAKGAGFWGQGTTQSRRERTPSLESVTFGWL